MRGQRIAGAAALIAVLTVVARVAGFGRVMVFTWAVGDTDLGDVYLAANLIPNIIFEIVAGGALAGLVVPLLAPAIAAGDRTTVARTVSALLTWAVTVLVPLAAVVVLAADPIMRLIAADPTTAEVEAGAAMLRVFAPQLPLYGVAIVLAGVLQAHRRFAWPVVAPLLSSLTVAAAYVLFVAVDRRGATVVEVGTTGLLVLAVGTTLGVVVLAGCMVGPVAHATGRSAAVDDGTAAVRGFRGRIRPGWRFEPGVRRRVGGLAAAGAVTVAAQHLALLVVLGQGMGGPDGTWVLFTLAQTIFLLPWAVLAVPLATAAYPSLAESAATGAHQRYGSTLAGTTRAVVVLCLLGTAAMAALADPVAVLLTHLMPSAAPDAAGRLAAALVGFAPALTGYGLFAVLSRALYARGDTRAVAIAAGVGWGAVAGAAVVLAAVLPPEGRAVALTAANSVGMTVLGVALVYAVVRKAGSGALAGLPRAAGAAVAAAALAAGAGRAVTMAAPPTPDALTALWSGMLAGVVVGMVFGAAAWVLDRENTGALLAAVTRQVRRDGMASRRTRRGHGDERAGDEEETRG